MKVLSVGHALVDYFIFGNDETPALQGLHLGSFNHLPQDRMHGVVTKLGGSSPMAGGSAANVVKLAAQLGLETMFAGKCGPDELGEIFKQEMHAAGVKCILQEGKSPTGICITYLSAGRRTIATARSAAGEITPELIKEILLNDVSVILVEGYLLFNREVLYHILRKAQEAKIKVAFDPGNLILIDDFREEILVLVENFVDYLFINEEEALSLTGMDLETSLTFLGNKCECLALKRGEKGSIVVHQGKKYPIHSIGPSIMDPTGAGDGYTAGFLYGLAHFSHPDEWGKSGALVAGEVISVPGSRLEKGQIKRLKTALESL